ncbi:MAG: 50S ribosome-binding GTPase [Proteobacteria bacterium]|nr:50S ribosome-binding GTPase [Pseudomonadota bacterium]
MPTNLPPNYFSIEKQFKEAQTTEEKLGYLEEMMSVVPKHKGTDKLRAELRKKISKLKTSPQSKKGAARKESVYNIGKEGAGQVIVLGPPNVGKSSLVANLTNAAPDISASPHTTWQPIPGMMPVEDIQIQLIDTPPLNPDYVDKGLFDLARRADLVLLVVDIQSDPFQQLEESASMLAENRIAPVRLKHLYPEQPRMTFIPFHVLANKNDSSEFDENVEIFDELLEDNWPYLPVSSEFDRNLDQLKAVVFERLEIIRVYAKTPGKPADMTAPFVLKKGDTVEQFAAKVHKDFAQNMKNARIWGSNVYDGQMVQRDHQLSDKDIVEVHI